MKQWYEKLFENYAEHYENESFVKGTIGEVDFIEKETKYNKIQKILDVGCGTGRHSIELAKRGYNVTGIDLSKAQLEYAKTKAKKEKVVVNFIKADARDIPFKNEFDLVIMVCEGAFPLMETDEMNFAVLKNASSALKNNGTFIFTTLNGLFPLFHSVKDFINKNQDHEISKANNFDLMTFRDFSELEYTDDKGNKNILKCNERYYVPSEITWLLKTIGFTDIDIFGSELGNWSRNKKLSINDYEMLVIAKKKANE